MDREALRRWLTSPHRTWRWTEGTGAEDTAERYRGVETTDAGLRWFRWSHRFGHGEDGLQGEVLQPWARFAADGPLEPMPVEARAELEAWYERHGAELPRPAPGRQEEPP